MKISLFLCIRIDGELLQLYHIYARELKRQVMNWCAERICQTDTVLV